MATVTSKTAAPKAGSAAPAGADKAKKAKTPRDRFVLRFRNPNPGIKEEARFVAVGRDGKYRSFAYISVRNAEGKVDKEASRRGITRDHVSFDEAKKAVEEAGKAAEQRGWLKRKAGTGGRKDAFDLSSLPAPTK